MTKHRPALLAAAVLVAGLGLTGCSEKRHCEHDATDTVVSNSYCEKNMQGYEWESGDSHKKKKKKKKH
ncbi:hypothetical protein [Actinomadura hibisca]|uniref:hypothetical protein n=1 Tax=Actinomadura hibisca TaxID=68565 RepID=UPI00082DF514|nr:hypothetical protein [Actinomadura hibisca]